MSKSPYAYHKDSLRRALVIISRCCAWCSPAIWLHLPGQQAMAPTLISLLRHVPFAADAGAFPAPFLRRAHLPPRVPLPPAHSTPSILSFPVYHCCYLSQWWNQFFLVFLKSLNNLRVFFKYGSGECWCKGHHEGTTRACPTSPPTPLSAAVLHMWVRVRGACGLRGMVHITVVKYWHPAEHNSNRGGLPLSSLCPGALQPPLAGHSPGFGTPDKPTHNSSAHSPQPLVHPTANAIRMWRITDVLMMSIPLAVSAWPTHCYHSPFCPSLPFDPSQPCCNISLIFAHFTRFSCPQPHAQHLQSPKCPEYPQKKDVGSPGRGGRCVGWKWRQLRQFQWLVWPSHAGGGSVRAPEAP